MRIVNNADKEVSWFCFNQKDAIKLIALASGDLKPGGGTFDYTPPSNQNDLYFVRFTDQGGGNELAGGIVKMQGQTITLNGAEAAYSAVVTTP